MPTTQLTTGLNPSRLTSQLRNSAVIIMVLNGRYDGSLQMAWLIMSYILCRDRSGRPAHPPRPSFPALVEMS